MKILRDALLPGEANDLGHRVPAFENVHFGAEFSGVGEIFFQRFFGGAREFLGLLNGDSQQLAVEPAHGARPAFEHGPGAAARRDADQNAFLGAPALQMPWASM